MIAFLYRENDDSNSYELMKKLSFVGAIEALDFAVVSRIIDNTVLMYCLYYDFALCFVVF